MSKRITTNQAERIRQRAEDFDCSIDELIEAIENNVVGESIGIQLRFNKTGKLPGEE